MRSIRGDVRALVVVSAVLAILVVLAPAGAAPGDLDGFVQAYLLAKAAGRVL